MTALESNNLYFRSKVNELITTLESNGMRNVVANKANLIVQRFIQVGDQNITLNLKSENQPNPEYGEIYLKNQDVFLGQRVAYYYSINNNRLYSGDINEQIFTNALQLYNGSISFVQNRVVASSSLSLHQFNKRKGIQPIFNSSGVLQTFLSEFDIHACSTELMPYWLLSGQRDNEVTISYLRALGYFSTLPHNLRIYVNIEGVLIPNAAQALGNLFLGI